MSWLVWPIVMEAAPLIVTTVADAEPDGVVGLFDDVQAHVQRRTPTPNAFGSLKIGSFTT